MPNTHLSFDSSPASTLKKALYYTIAWLKAGRIPRHTETFTRTGYVIPILSTTTKAWGKITTNDGTFQKNTRYKTCRIFYHQMLLEKSPNNPDEVIMFAPFADMYTFLEKKARGESKRKRYDSYFKNWTGQAITDTAITFYPGSRWNSTKKEGEDFFTYAEIVNWECEKCKLDNWSIWVSHFCVRCFSSRIGRVNVFSSMK